jgi:hypothetical protein
MSLPNVADIAVIILVIHALIGCMVPLVLFFFVARGAILLNQKTREVLPLVQDYARQMADGADQVSQRIAEPVLKVEATRAGWQARWQRSTAALARKPEEDEEPTSGSMDSS